MIKEEKLKIKMFKKRGLFIGVFLIVLLVTPFISSFPPAIDYYSLRDETSDSGGFVGSAQPHSEETKVLIEKYGLFKDDKNNREGDNNDIYLDNYSKYPNEELEVRINRLEKRVGIIERLLNKIFLKVGNKNKKEVEKWMD